MSSTALTCPICGRPSLADYRPFCSRRCADVDLGHWLRGSYRVPSVEEDDPDDFELSEPDEPKH